MDKWSACEPVGVTPFQSSDGDPMSTNAGAAAADSEEAHHINTRVGPAVGLLFNASTLPARASVRQKDVRGVVVESATTKVRSDWLFLTVLCVSVCAADSEEGC